MKILIKENKKKKEKTYVIIECEENRRYKVGDIIYPYYNKTSEWYKKSRWDLVVKVNKKGNPIDTRYIWNYATVRAIELIALIQKSNKTKLNTDERRLNK